MTNREIAMTVKVGDRVILRCEGCDAEIPWTKRAGRIPKWCSQKCRKKQYAPGACESCGKPTSYGNGKDWKKASRFCAACYDERETERNERIFQAWSRGESGPTIGAREGLSYQAVQSLVDSHRRLYGRSDLALHRGRSRARWPEIEAAYREGLTYREIGERVGITDKNVGMQIHYMRRAGFDLPSRVPKRKPVAA